MLRRWLLDLPRSAIYIFAPDPQRNVDIFDPPARMCIDSVVSSYARVYLAKRLRVCPCTCTPGDRRHASTLSEKLTASHGSARFQNILPFLVEFLIFRVLPAPFLPSGRLLSPKGYILCARARARARQAFPPRVTRPFASFLSFFFFFTRIVRANALYRKFAYSKNIREETSARALYRPDARSFVFLSTYTMHLVNKVVERQPMSRYERRTRCVCRTEWRARARARNLPRRRASKEMRREINYPARLKNV